MGGVVLFDVCSSRSIQFRRPVPAYSYACPDLLLERQISAKRIPRYLRWLVCVHHHGCQMGLLAFFGGGMGGRLWLLSRLYGCICLKWEL